MRKVLLSFVCKFNFVKREHLCESKVHIGILKYFTYAHFIIQQVNKTSQSVYVS